MLWLDEKLGCGIAALPMQDEPEGLGMLEIEHQRARGREVKLGSDWPVRRGQRGNPV
jgi:hypothetical protein